MGWFSQNFPSIARLFSAATRGGGETSANGARRRRGRRSDRTNEPAGNGPSQPEATEFATETAGHPQSENEPSELTPFDALESQTSEEPHEEMAPGSALGTDTATSAITARTTSMDQMYETWVGLEDTIAAAQRELESLLTNRKNTEVMRSKARELLADSEAAWREAGRLGEAAKQAFERGFTVNLPGFATRLRMIKEIEEARLTQVHLTRSNNMDAWEEADRARQKATTELLKALTAIAAAAAQVNREHREAENLPVTAESLRNSALEDLRCAQVVRDELALLGRDAFNLLSATDLSIEPAVRSDVPLEPLPAQLQTQQIDPSDNRMAPGALNEQGTEADATPIAPQGAQWTPPTPDTPPSEAQAPAEPAVEAPRTVAEAAPAAAQEAEQVATVSAADLLRQELEAGASALPPAAQAPIAEPGASVPENEAVAEGQTPVANELERELEAMRSLLANTEPAVAPTPENAPPPESGAPAPIVDAVPQPREPSRPIPGAYTGRLFLMFPAALGQDQLEAVWEALDEVAGSGAIIDNRLVSREAGIQFTLELGSKTLTVENLLKRMPGAQLAVVDDDRLRVDWPRQG